MATSRITLGGLSPYLSVLVRGVRIVLYVLGAPYAATFLSDYSGWLIVWKDYCCVESIGVITHTGFPIPWQVTGPGIELFGSRNWGRFGFNAAMWAVILVMLALHLEKYLQARRWSSLSSTLLALGGSLVVTSVGLWILVHASWIVARLLL